MERYNPTTLDQTNNSLDKSWNFKLPSTYEYFAYYDQRMIYFIYANSKKEITQIDVGNPNYHKTLKNSKLFFFEFGEFGPNYFKWKSP